MQIEGPLSFVHLPCTFPARPSRLGSLHKGVVNQFLPARKVYKTWNSRVTRFPQNMSTTIDPLPRKIDAGGNKLIAKVIKVFEDIGRLCSPFWQDKERRMAWTWTVATLLLAITTSTYVTASAILQRRFFTILQKADKEAFTRFMAAYASAVIIRPFIMESYKWCKAQLSLKWRDVLTRKFLKDYFGRMNYYRLTMGNIDNPDQRISDDVRVFTKQAITLLCQCFTASIEFVIFSVLLYKIYPPLYPTLVLYVAAGIVATILAGRRLIPLNKNQRAREADYRFGLVRCRENAESIAFFGGENGESTELKSRFWLALRNSMQLITLERNVGILTTGHRSLVQILPCLVVAKRYFSGTVAFGNIYLVFFAFNHVLQSIGLVVSEFLAISELGAGLSRLSELDRCLETEALATTSTATSIKTIRSERPEVTLRDLSIVTPSYPPRSLVRDLNLKVAQGRRLLVVGPSGVGKSSLMRCVAGLWMNGSGSVTVPEPKDTLFLPQRPYLTLGTLRENVAYPLRPESVSDADIKSALVRVNLPSVVQRVGGLDCGGERLSSMLSLGEQQRLSFARLVLYKPSVCILDESTSALDMENEDAMYKIVQDMKITCLSVGNRRGLVKFHNEVLRLNSDGSWALESPQGDPIIKTERSLH